MECLPLNVTATVAGTYVIHFPKPRPQKLEKGNAANYCRVDDGLTKLPVLPLLDLARGCVRLSPLTRGVPEACRRPERIGKTVKFRCGPAAVTGDERRIATAE